MRAVRYIYHWCVWSIRASCKGDSIGWSPISWTSVDCWTSSSREPSDCFLSWMMSGSTRLLSVADSLREAVCVFTVSVLTVVSVSSSSVSVCLSAVSICLLVPPVCVSVLSAVQVVSTALGWEGFLVSSCITSDAAVSWCLGEYDGEASWEDVSLVLSGLP